METLADKSLHNRQGMLDDINHAVERFNQRAAVIQRSDFENYINGDIKFAVEYGGRDHLTEAKRVAGGQVPNYITATRANCDIFKFKPRWKIRDLLSEYMGVQFSVVCYWGGKSILARVVDLIDEPEKFVPSLFVWLEGDHTVGKYLPNAKGISLLKGFLKRVFILNERIVEPASFGTEAMNSFSANHRYFVHNGFIPFSEGGAPEGICLCFNTVNEGRRFSDKFRNFSDFFRCPTYLQG